MYNNIHLLKVYMTFRIEFFYIKNKGNNKITELRTILQRESQNSSLYKQTKSVNNRKTVKKLRLFDVLY
jgi:hypothetical protein